MGWEVVGESVLELLKKSPLTQLSNMCKLATSLHIEAKKHVREEPNMNIGTNAAGTSKNTLSFTPTIASNVQEDKHSEAGGRGVVSENVGHTLPDIRIEGALDTAAPSFSVIAINTFDSAIAFTSTLQADKHNEAGGSDVVVRSIAHTETDVQSKVALETAAPSSLVSDTPGISLNLREDKHSEAGGSSVVSESKAHTGPDVHSEVASETAAPSFSVSTVHVENEASSDMVVVVKQDDSVAVVAKQNDVAQDSVSTTSGIAAGTSMPRMTSTSLVAEQKMDSAAEIPRASGFAPLQTLNVEASPHMEVLDKLEDSIATEQSLVSISDTVAPISIPVDTPVGAPTASGNVEGMEMVRHEDTVAVEQSVVSILHTVTPISMPVEISTSVLSEQKMDAATHNTEIGEDTPLETCTTSSNLECSSNMDILPAVPKQDDSLVGSISMSVETPPVSNKVEGKPAVEQKGVLDEVHTALGTVASADMPVRTPAVSDNVEGSSNMDVVASQLDSFRAEQVLYTTADIIALNDMPTGASADSALEKKNVTAADADPIFAHSVRTLANTSAVVGVGERPQQPTDSMLLSSIRIVASRGISSFNTLTNESATALLLWILDLGDNVCYTHRVAMLSKVKELQMGVLLHVMNALEKDRMFIERAMKAEPPGPTYRASYAYLAQALLQPHIISKFTAQNIQTAFLNLDAIARCEIKSQPVLRAYTRNGELCTLETKFANIILGLSDGIKQPVLCGLLKTAALNEQKSTDFVQQFVHARCNYLRRLPTARTLPSNGFPQANIPAHPTVTAFLRGEEADFTYQTGSGIVRARKIASEIQRAGRDNRWNATPGGTGKGAYVSIKKVNATTSAQRQAHASTLNELKAVMRMIVNQNGNNLHGNMHTNIYTGAANTAPNNNVIHQQNGSNVHGNIHINTNTPMNTGGWRVGTYPHANTANTSVRDQNGSTSHGNIHTQMNTNTNIHTGAGSVRHPYTALASSNTSSTNVIDLVGSSSTSKSASKRPAVQMSDGPYDDVEVVQPPPKKPVPVIDISDSP